MGVLEITPGLLISMAIRLDHSFGLRNNNPFWGNEETAEEHADRQIKLIREVALSYKKIKSLINETTWDYKRSTVEDRQLAEEMTCTGYYKPDLELVYRGWATDDALLEALRIAREKPEFDGPKPSVTFTDTTGVDIKSLMFD